MKKELFSKDWLFTYTPLIGSKDKEPEKIDLPHDYMIRTKRSADSPNGPGAGYYQAGNGLYEKYFSVPEQAGHMILDVDGAYMCATVSLNRNQLVLHPHGYTPFLVDLSDRVVPGKLNKLTIETLSLPCSMRWYSGGGIYRDIFLWTGGKVRVEPRDLFVTTERADAQEALLNCAYEISSDVTGEAVVKTELLDAEGKRATYAVNTICITEGEKTPLTAALYVTSPRCWNLEDPYLYTVHTEIVTDGEITDTADTKIGIRTFSMTPENGFVLNGKPIKMRGGCIHHDHGALGAAAYPAAEERKIRRLKDTGFNAVRTAHNPPSTALLEVCDRLGMIVMDEAFDMWNEKKNSYDYHLFFADHWARDIASMVLRERNHPCVYSYSTGNEIWERDGHSDGYAWVKKLADEIRKYDTTRPVTQAIPGNWIYPKEYDPEEYKEIFMEGYEDIGTGELTSSWYPRMTGTMEALDIIGYNYRYDRYDEDHKNHPERVIWGSETHALTFYDGWAATMRNSNVIGDFVWTAYDNLGEAGAGQWRWARDGVMDHIEMGGYPWRTCFQGDLDLCGYRRPQSYFKETVWLGNTEPKLFTTHPEHYGEGLSGTGWHWHDVHDAWTFEDQYIGKPVRCEVYTDADEVEFILNGRVLGRAVPEKDIAYFDVPYEKGVLETVAYKNGQAVGRSKTETVGAAAKILLTPEKPAVMADGRDLCYIDITVADAEGRRHPFNYDVLTASVEGGELAGVFSADPCNEDDYTGDSCHAFEGRALLIVKTKNAGTVKICVKGEGLQAGTAEITAEA